MVQNICNLPLAISFHVPLHLPHQRNTTKHKHHEKPRTSIWCSINHSVLKRPEGRNGAKVGAVHT